IIAKITIKEGWHINALKIPEGGFGYPTTFAVEKSPNYQLVGEPIVPKPVYKFSPAIGAKAYLYEGTIVLKQKIKIISDEDFDAAINFQYQTCNDEKCLFPTRFDDFIVHVKGCSASK